MGWARPQGTVLMQSIPNTLASPGRSDLARDATSDRGVSLVADSIYHPGPALKPRRKAPRPFQAQGAGAAHFSSSRADFNGVPEQEQEQGLLAQTRGDTHGITTNSIIGA